MKVFRVLRLLKLIERFDPAIALMNQERQREKFKKNNERTKQKSIIGYKSIMNLLMKSRNVESSYDSVFTFFSDYSLDELGETGREKKKREKN